MNMKRTVFTMCALSAFTLILPWPFRASAEENTQSQDSARMQQSIADESASRSSDQSAMNQLTGGEQGKAQAKTALAPHSIIIQTDLQSALDQVKGLRSQVKASPQPPTQDDLDHYKIHGRSINENLMAVRTHEGHLQSNVSRFQKVAQSDEFKNLDPAINNVERLNRDWQGKINQKNYWKNRNQVLSDLDTLERRLMAAIDKTKDFNSKDLDLSVEVG